MRYLVVTIMDIIHLTLRSHVGDSLKWILDYSAKIKCSWYHRSRGSRG